MKATILFSHLSLLATLLLTLELQLMLHKTGAMHTPIFRREPPPAPIFERAAAAEAAAAEGAAVEERMGGRLDLDEKGPSEVPDPVASGGEESQSGNVAVAAEAVDKSISAEGASDSSPEGNEEPEKEAWIHHRVDELVKDQVETLTLSLLVDSAGLGRGGEGHT